MKTEKPKKLIRWCILGAVGCGFMAAGDWLLGCIPLRETDTGLFNRAYYLSGSYGLWRPILTVGLGAVGGFLYYFMIKALNADIDEKYRKIMQSVQNALGNCSRQSPAEAKNLKDKMHAVKSMERRFEKEDENMTEMPEQEEAIFFKLGDKDSSIPAGKTVIEYTLAKLTTRDEERILAEDINLKIRGSEKICIIGANGVGKTTLLRKIAEELSQRDDIKAEYMPQNYEEILDLDMTPVDFLDKSGDKEERTRIRTYLGSLKYTADEMEHPIRELSGGQKAKVLLLSMSLSGANVLILDEPTRNFSPLSGPVIRKMLREFPGAIISISHDRKYIDEVCDKIYELDYSGLRNL